MSARGRSFVPREISCLNPTPLADTACFQDGVGLKTLGTAGNELSWCAQELLRWLTGELTDRNRILKIFYIAIEVNHSDYVLYCRR
ncbi:hypothetical protein QQP08_024440 [Theobroma cacao]|nr:hypothetical protein QQP08_024440 [Theobroma cacao]